MEGTQQARVGCYCCCSHGPSKSDSFYLEKMPLKTTHHRKKNYRRPASAGNGVKPITYRKRGRAQLTKTTSDPQLSKSKTNISKKSWNTTGCTGNMEELKKELKNIKEHLVHVVKNKSDALNVTNELEVRYSKLKNKYKKQEEEITNLQNRNDKLLKIIQEQKNLEGVRIQDVKTAKISLDEYEKTLNTLYDEFLETSQVMERNKEKLCQCIIRNNNKHESLLSTKSKSNKKQSGKTSTKLKKSVQKLEEELRQTWKKLEDSQQELTMMSKKHKENILQNNKQYSHQLEEKTKKIKELNVIIQQLKNKHNSLDNPNLNFKYQQLEHCYQHLLENVKAFEKEYCVRNQELLQLQNANTTLSSELQDLKKSYEQVTAASECDCQTIAQMNTLNNEKEALLQLQKIELTSKDKQVELLSKNEERLKQKLVELQEQLVSMKISSNSTNSYKGCVERCEEDCSVFITQELQDLITALYGEMNKSLQKDEQLQELHQEICYLKCTLSEKEKDLSKVYNELQKIKQELNSTLKENQNLNNYLKKASNNRRKTSFQKSEDSEAKVSYFDVTPLNCRCVTVV